MPTESDYADRWRRLAREAIAAAHEMRDPECTIGKPIVDLRNKKQGPLATDLENDVAPSLDPLMRVSKDTRDPQSVPAARA